MTISRTAKEAWMAVEAYQSLLYLALGIIFSIFAYFLAMPNNPWLMHLSIWTIGGATGIFAINTWFYGTPKTQIRHKFLFEGIVFILIFGVLLLGIELLQGHSPEYLGRPDQDFAVSFIFGTLIGSTSPKSVEP